MIRIIFIDMVHVLLNHTLLISHQFTLILFEIITSVYYCKLLLIYFLIKNIKTNKIHIILNILMNRKKSDITIIIST